MPKPLLSFHERAANVRHHIRLIENHPAEKKSQVVVFFFNKESPGAKNLLEDGPVECGEVNQIHRSGCRAFQSHRQRRFLFCR